MSDRMRITGMNSGMDTETIVQQLVLAKKVKVDNLKNDQKKLEWKQTAWQDLNSKIYNLYSSTLSKLRLTGAYKKKTTTISDPSKATVTADGNAPDGTQKLEIKQLATAGYITGDKIAKEAKSYTPDKKMSDIDPSVVDKTIVLTDKNDNGIKKEITIGADMKISDFVEELKSYRYEASYNAGSYEIPVSSTKPLTITGSNDILNQLGIAAFTNTDATNGWKVQVPGGLDPSKSLISDIKPGVVDKTITLTGDSGDKTITITKDMTYAKLVDEIKAAGYEASYKAESYEMHNSATITVTGSDANLLTQLGITQESTGGWKMQVPTGLGSSKSMLKDIDPSMVGKTITLEDGDFKKTIKITNDMTYAKLVDEMKAARYEASFDEKNQRFEIRDQFSTFTMSDKDASGDAKGSVLSKLGISASSYVTDGWIRGSSINQVATTYTASTKLSNLDPNLFKGKEVTVGAGTEDDPQKKQVKYTELVVTAGKGAKQKETKIELKEDMTISNLLTQLRDAGLNASFDETNQRFFLSAKDTGEENDFTIRASNLYEPEKATLALDALGLTQTAIGKKIAGEDSKIILNGVEYTSARNAYSINGLTVNATGVTDGEITITTSTDYKGAYDTIKEFLSEYNDLINEIDKSYNADSARKYKMLSDDQKDAMSDEEVEKWEGTIKGSLLRKDTQLRTIMDVLTRSMNESLYVNGKKMHLSDYGIKTLDYFKAKDNEHYAYHIDGDADDDNVSGEKDKLMKALMADPDGTIQFFADLSRNVYDKVGEIMNKTSAYSSIYKVYNDKQLKKDYDNYSKKIKDAEDKLSAYEDKWYDKFAKMEKALAKLQSNQSAVSGMLGK